MQATKSTYAGLFLIALATLMYEILLTRIFSTTTYYHFAFFAISLAMLGMTVGAIIVYLAPQRFTQEKTHHYLTVSALGFSLISLLAVLVHIMSPPLLPGAPNEIMATSLLLSVVPLLAAFICSGICASLTLTRFPGQLSKLYAVDLAGAALGCLMLVVSLQIIDGITDVFFIAFLGVISAMCFSARTAEYKLKTGTAIAAVALLAFVGINGYMANEQKPLVRLSWSKGIKEQHNIYEKWNSFSRIRVDGEGELVRPLFEAGLSHNYKPDTGRYLRLDMDGGAGTHLFKFDGNFDSMGFLRHDLTILAHYLRPDSNVLIIGVGGEREILASLALGQKSVTGVEINDNIINTVNKKFGDYTGHLDRNPKVTIVNDEARSFLTRSPNRYDIIQATLIDTWAASSSGAYALTENSLYTVEGWDVFLNHLSDHGVVSMTRWYAKSTPAEIYRLLVLASTALKKIGVEDPANHIVLARLMSDKEGQPDGLGTLLVGRSAFTASDLDTLEKVCKENGWEITLSPRGALDPLLKVAADDNTTELAQKVPFDISASSDDRPFFFQNLSLAHIFDPTVYVLTRNANNVMAAISLLVSMIAVTFFSFYCMRLPYLMTKDKSILKGTQPLFVYFFGIGLGFMLVELSQIQRFSVFLGHPIYAISVVLFTLLLGTGTGSMLFGTVYKTLHQKAPSVIITLLVVAGTFGLLAPFVASTFGADSTPIRIAIAVGTLFPLGFVLGMAFPLGMKLAFSHHDEVTPWLWGINGAASVCGSVLSTVISMFVGINATYWLGFLFYAMTLAAVLRISKDNLSSPAEIQAA